jgi:hypothetical protein
MKTARLGRRTGFDAARAGSMGGYDAGRFRWGGEKDAESCFALSHCARGRRYDVSSRGGDASGARLDHLHSLLGAIGFAQLALAKQRNLLELVTDKPLEQSLSVVTFGNSTPVMQATIDAARHIAANIM